MYQGWGIRPGLSLKPVIPHLTDGGHQLGRRRIATAPPVLDTALGAVGCAGPQRTRVLLDQRLLHLEPQWALPKQHQSKTTPDPRPAHSEMSLLPLPFQRCHSGAIPDPQRESLKNVRANSTSGHPASQRGLSCSHVTPPCLSHARSCLGLAPLGGPRGDPGAEQAAVPRVCFPSWSSKRTSLPKAVQIWDVKLPLKHRYSHHTRTVYFLNHQVKIQACKCYPKVATLHASHVPWILKGSAFRPLSTPPQCNRHFYQGSCLMAPINFDF